MEKPRRKTNPKRHERIKQRIKQFNDLEFNINLEKIIKYIEQQNNN